MGHDHSSPGIESQGHRSRSAPKTHILGACIGISEPNAQAIKTCVLSKTCILSKLLHRILPDFVQWRRPPKYSLCVVQISVWQIKDGGRPPSWIVEKRPHLSSGSTCRCEIWYADTQRLYKLYWSLKFRILEIQDGGRPPAMDRRQWCILTLRTVSAVKIVDFYMSKLVDGQHLKTAIFYQLLDRSPGNLEHNDDIEFKVIGQGQCKMCMLHDY